MQSTTLYWCHCKEDKKSKQTVHKEGTVKQFAAASTHNNILLRLLCILASLLSGAKLACPPVHELVEGRSTCSTFVVALNLMALTALLHRGGTIAQAAPESGKQ